MDSFSAQRAIKTYSYRIPETPARLFPLLCPVREYDWIDGWTCRMIFSRSGLAEDNCVFQTDFKGAGEETWVVSRYDPERFIIQFVVLNPGLYVMKLDVSLRADGEAGTIVDWTNTFTGLTEKGNAFITEYTDQRHAAVMSHLEQALRHYCLTGQMLKAPSTRKDPRSAQPRT
ncbi:MAG: hypothetical protein AB1641_19290 [Thermodesulfobacteriota bacterium]